MMARMLFVALLLALSASGVKAAEPFARTEILTEGDIVAGQQIEIAVDIFVPNFFKSAPDFEPFDLPDAIVTLPEQRAQNIVQTVDGVQYAGIRRSYLVIPRNAGDYTLPHTTFAVAYANDSGEPETGSVSLPPTRFSVRTAPGKWTAQAPLVATGVTISQTLDRDPATLKAGDALVRNLTIRAENTQSMMIPILTLPVPGGVKLYRADPVLTEAGADKDNPEASARSQVLTYVAEKPGSFSIPAVSIQWFDPSTRQVTTASTPAIKLVVAANPASAQAIPAGEAPATFDSKATRIAVYRHLAKTASIAVAAVLAFALLYLFGSRLRERWIDFAHTHAESEHVYFGRVKQALMADDAEAVWRAIDAWTRRAGFRSISQWVAGVDDPELSSAVTGLERSLYGKGGAGFSPADRQRLRVRLSVAYRLGSASKPSIRQSDRGLTTLNPWME
jgi:hypothetical protein